MADLVDAAAGLSADEAASRLARDGANELPAARRDGAMATLLSLLREPMLFLLLAAAAVYMFLGEAADAATLSALVLLVMGITFVQQRKTQRALEALRDLSSPRASVIRDGRRTRIPSRDLVRGDLVVLAEGDRVAADGRLVEAVNLRIDESLLTGESVPASKAPGGAGSDGDAGDRVSSGTLVVGGHGAFIVDAVGARTQFGRIGAMLDAVAPPRTPLQLEVARFVRRLALIAIALCAAVAAAYILRRSDWTGGMLAGLTLAMALLPEEFPVVLTVFQAMGAWRISRSNVLTRRMSAIEALGSATVLCADKTGTLTTNRMRIATIVSEGDHYDVPMEGGLPQERFAALIDCGVFASQAVPADPMEIAFHDLGRRVRTEPSTRRSLPLLREYPLTPRLFAVVNAYGPGPDGSTYVAAKGAPEAIVELCRLDAASAAAVHAEVEALASSGLRVLAIAEAGWSGARLPDDQRGFPFRLLGLVGLEDPVRPGVADAVRDCRAAGIRVIMITGDFPRTAAAIGSRIGIPSDRVMTGRDIDAADDDALRRRLRDTSIFARVVPSQKLRLVHLLAADGEVVAMTGDGVNDAPALKAAHIGIAMGGRGSDVARESAALVLTDDDFTSLVRVLRLGRRIFDNLRKAMMYVLAVHIPIAGLSVIPVILGEPMLLLPVHVAFLELMVDPACALGFESQPAESDVMLRPPRRAGAPLFDARMIAVALLQGASVLVGSMIVYAYGHSHGGDDAARAMAFSALIGGNIALILINRTWHIDASRWRDPISLAVTGGALSALIASLALPPLRALFHFAPLTSGEAAAAIGTGLLSTAWFEAVKLARPRWLAPSPPAPTAGRSTAMADGDDRRADERA